MIRRLTALLSCALAMLSLTGPAAAASVDSADWRAYADAFVEPNGRVVDTANGRISHSEGQGYGMLLAFLADDRGDFERIWSFTRTELLLRDDGLAMWRWDPASTPRVTDPNNASDGDILIAYALGLAGQAWQRPDLTNAGAALATSIGDKVVVQHGGAPILLPGVEGYGRDARDDGPVVNLSYWIFEAFPVLRQLAPDTDWEALSQNGIALTRRALGPERPLPPEWLSVQTVPRPAKGFKDEFGYNAIRIPLYLIRGEVAEPELIRSMISAMAPDGTAVNLTDLNNGQVTERLTDPGYRILPALAACALDGTAIPAELRRFQPTLYYPSTLHLLSLAYVAERHPECLS
ncbi:glycosyl hydrolase family 8 [Aureimonas altamirensis]|uniref:glycosyl hydrolase family 8 n=1 Tax=Aureimonas altamirensis TaxID=370622 RepID=UPI002036AFDC|nr:glycosyl hydrolase family 8 [Aureimonas altamirensis]MCM2505967.1 glycosyl hydrolase family 8 [Aureimonas altamirensis]